MTALAPDGNDVIAWALDDTSAPPWVNAGTGGTLDLVQKTATHSANVSVTTSNPLPGDADTHSLLAPGNAVGGGYNYASTDAALSGGTTIGESTSITASAFVRLAAYTNGSGGNGYEMLFAKNGDPTAPLLTWFLSLNNTNDGAWYFDVDTGSGDQAVGYASGVKLPLNQWAHFGATYDASTKLITTYQNGVQTAQVTADGSQVIQYHNHGGYDLGGGVNQNALNAEGQFKHVRVANIARNVSWFKAMAAVTLTLTPPTRLCITGTSTFFVATATFLDGHTEDVSSDPLTTWASSDPTIATVSGGEVTGVAAGSVTITVTFGGITLTTTVSVVTTILATRPIDADDVIVWSLADLVDGHRQLAQHRDRRHARPRRGERGRRAARRRV